jgi:hypothetical protein
MDLASDGRPLSNRLETSDLKTPRIPIDYDRDSDQRVL